MLCYRIRNNCSLDALEIDEVFLRELLTKNEYFGTSVNVNIQNRLRYAMEEQRNSFALDWPVKVINK